MTNQLYDKKELAKSIRKKVAQFKLEYIEVFKQGDFIVATAMGRPSPKDPNELQTFIGVSKRSPEDKEDITLGKLLALSRLAYNKKV